MGLIGLHALGGIVRLDVSYDPASGRIDSVSHAGA